MIGLENASLSLGGRRLLSDVSFRVATGRTLAVLGPNGRGKTTLLNAVMGFRRLDAGRRIAPRVVGYVPQASAGQARLSGLEMVVMGSAARRGLFGQPGAEDHAAARAALDEVGAGELADLMFDRMSGGQRQLVLIARALATGAPALAFDEPTSALDLGNQARTLDLVNRLRQRRDRAIIFTTHDPNHALVAADDVLLMQPGDGERHGSVADLIRPEPLSTLYGVPMVWVDVPGPDGAVRRAILPAFSGKAAA